MRVFFTWGAAITLALLPAAAPASSISGFFTVSGGYEVDGDLNGRLDVGETIVPNGNGIVDAADGDFLLIDGVTPVDLIGQGFDLLFDTGTGLNVGRSFTVGEFAVEISEPTIAALQIMGVSQFAELSALAVVRDANPGSGLDFHDTVATFSFSASGSAANGVPPRGSYSIFVETVPPIPVPAGLPMALGALALLAALRRRR